MKVLGLDGGSSRWVSVAFDGSEATVEVLPLELDHSSLSTFDVVAIDTPIGLIDGGRQADSMARKCLEPYTSSVFSSPCRSALPLDYREACEENQRVCGKGLSKQSHGIFRYIKSADDLLLSSPALRSSVIEGHPEVTFRSMASSPLKPKKSLAGQLERIRLLASVFGTDFYSVLTKQIPARFELDLIDALAMAHLAACHALGATNSLPSTPEIDPLGIQAAIWYPAAKITR